MYDVPSVVLVRFLHNCFKALAFQEGDLHDLANLAKVDIILSREPADSLVEKGLVGPDLFQEPRQGHFSLFFQCFVDLSRRFADPIILFLHIQTLSALR